MTDYFAGSEGRLRPGDAAVALIVVGSERRYLMQLRDQKPGIFYPGHWGLFGGATDPGETPEQTLQRELREELSLRATSVVYFTEFEFDFEFSGFGRLKRRFYEVILGNDAVRDLSLGEGSEMRLFAARENLNMPRVVPYDAFAIWLHAEGQIAFKL
jgi:8-oxo-dGTP pyrophosphatase MutT (NUDIX family)